MGLVGWFLFWGSLCLSVHANAHSNEKDPDATCRSLIVTAPIISLVKDFYEWRDREVREAVTLWKQTIRHWNRVADSNAYGQEYRDEARGLADKYALWVEHAEGQHDRQYINWKIALYQVASTGSLFVDAVRMGNPHQDIELRQLGTSKRCHFFLDEALRRRFGTKVSELPRHLKPQLSETQRIVALNYLESIGGRPPHPDTLERLRSRPLVSGSSDSKLMGRVDFYRLMAWGNQRIDWENPAQLKALGEWIDALESVL